MTTTQILEHLANLTLTPPDYFATLSDDGLFTQYINLSREARRNGLAGDERNARRLVLASLLVNAYLTMRENRTMYASTLPDLEHRVKAFFIFEQNFNR